MRKFVAFLLLASCAPPPRESVIAREGPPATAPPAADARADAELTTEPVDASEDVPVAPFDATQSQDTTDNSADTGVASACPAAFASGGGLCNALGKKCEFPQGTCSCAVQNYCGGAAPNPALMKQLSIPRWLCSPSPKVLGPDGCPLGIPSGMTCSTPGKKCSYTPCCAFTMTCTGGKWLPGQASCPP